MRAFILGNSGELLDHDLDKLKGEAVFGVNALPIYKPDIITHYVCADIGMAFVPEVRALVSKDCKKYYSRLMWNCIDHEDNVNVFDCYDDRLRSFEISTTKIYLCQTVTYAALQIAAGLGYDEIYLLGIDLGLPANGIMHIPAQELLTTLIKEKNLHNPTVDKRFPNLGHERLTKSMKHNFIIAKKVLDENGIKVYNLSNGGNLNCFDRRNYEQVLGEK